MTTPTHQAAPALREDGPDSVLGALTVGVWDAVDVAVCGGVTAAVTEAVWDAVWDGVRSGAWAVRDVVRDVLGKKNR